MHKPPTSHNIGKTSLKTSQALKHSEEDSWTHQTPLYEFPPKFLRSESYIPRSYCPGYDISTFWKLDPDHYHHLGPCGKEELLHLWVGGNVGSSQEKRCNIRWEGWLLRSRREMGGGDPPRTRAGWGLKTGYGIDQTAYPSVLSHLWGVENEWNKEKRRRR